MSCLAAPLHWCARRIWLSKSATFNTGANRHEMIMAPPHLLPPLLAGWRCFASSCPWSETTSVTCTTWHTASCAWDTPMRVMRVTMLSCFSHITGVVAATYWIERLLRVDPANLAAISLRTIINDRRKVSVGVSVGARARRLTAGTAKQHHWTRGAGWCGCAGGRVVALAWWQHRPCPRGMNDIRAAC